MVLAIFSGLWVMAVFPKCLLSTGQSRAAETLVVLCYEPSCLSGALLQCQPGSAARSLTNFVISA